MPEWCILEFNFQKYLHHVDEYDNEEQYEQGYEPNVDCDGSDEGEAEDEQGEQEEHEDQVEDSEPPIKTREVFLMRWWHFQI